MCIKFEGAFYERNQLQKKNKSEKKKKAQKKTDAYGADFNVDSITWYCRRLRIFYDRNDSANVF